MVVVDIRSASQSGCCKDEPNGNSPSAQRRCHLIGLNRVPFESSPTWPLRFKICVWALESPDAALDILPFAQAFRAISHSGD
jgi:hypothetical protein